MVPAPKSGFQSQDSSQVQGVRGTEPEELRARGSASRLGKADTMSRAERTEGRRGGGWGAKMTRKRWGRRKRELGSRNEEGTRERTLKG
eukprot:3147602-Rhodomonas_salina.1